MLDVAVDRVEFRRQEEDGEHEAQRFDDERSELQEWLLGVEARRASANNADGDGGDGDDDESEDEEAAEEAAEDG